MTQKSSMHYKNTLRNIQPMAFLKHLHTCAEKAKSGTIKEFTGYIHCFTIIKGVKGKEDYLKG